MRKVMLLAAMLAMVLAAAAPALAQATSVVGDDNQGNVATAQYVDCSQVQAAVQAQYGDTTGIAAADNNSSAVAAVAQNQGITSTQVNACLGEINVGGSVAAASPAAASPAAASVAAGGVLPETGGASLLALGAGALLVAGGLLARRIVR